MHKVDTRLRKAIYEWLDKHSEYGNYYFYEDPDFYSGSIFSVASKKGNNDTLFFYFGKNKGGYRYQGEYPLVYIRETQDLKNFVSFFGRRHIPIMVDYYSEKLKKDLPYRSLIWGCTSELDSNMTSGIHGEFCEDD